MKKLLCLVLSLLMVLSLAACGGGSNATTAAPATQGGNAGTEGAKDWGIKTQVTSTEKVTIRLAYDVAEAHPSHKATVEKFKDVLEGVTNGNIPTLSWAPWPRTWNPCVSATWKWLT